MSLKASDVAKLAAGIAAGYFTADYITGILEDDDDSAIEKALKMCAGIGTANVASSLTSSLMDATGASDVIDDVAGGITDLFDW